MGRSTIYMAMFNSYVSLPEGKLQLITYYNPQKDRHEKNRK